MVKKPVWVMAKVMALFRLALTLALARTGFPPSPKASARLLRSSKSEGEPSLSPGRFTSASPEHSPAYFPTEPQQESVPGSQSSA